MKALNFKIAATVISVLLLALGIVLYVSAVENRTQEQTATRSLENKPWYFTGDADDDPTLPENYTDVPPSEDPCDFEPELICEIWAPDDGEGNPDMEAPVGSSTVEDQILEAHASLQTTTPQLNATVTAFRSE